jgi:hypothetical protein
MDYDLSGMLDLHIHTKPDIQPRLLDDIQAAASAKSAGMQGILIKSHVVSTAGRAEITEKAVGGIRVFGSLVLNTAVGGFNMEVLETAIQMGAKIIWMPTHNAQSMFYRSGRRGGLSIFSESHTILPVIHDILDRIRQADIALATGHLSIEEIVALVHLAKSMGLKKIIITHPDSVLISMPLDIQQKVCGSGVFFERCLLDTLLGPVPGTTIREIGNHIRGTTVAANFLSTDLGQPNNPLPIEGFSQFIVGLRKIGFTEKEIYQMGAETPASLMDL